MNNQSFDINAEAEQFLRDWIEEDHTNKRDPVAAALRTLLRRAVESKTGE